VRAGGARGRTAVGALVVLTLGAGTVGALQLHGPDEQLSASAVEAREPLPAPAAPPARAPLLHEAGADSDAPAPTRSGLGRAVDAALADPALAGGLAVSLVDVGAREVLLERGADRLLIPASTAKIVTGVAALTTLDPDLRLATSVVAGERPGEVVLVGGGDSTLVSGPSAQGSFEEARLDVLAAQARTALGTTPVTRVLVDDSLYTGPALGPGWKPTYVTEGNVAPVMALMVDAGRERPGRSARVGDPALAAGQALARMLGGAPAVARGTAPAGARALASVAGPPVSALVERMLAASDNDVAETLGRQVALAQGQPASFAGVASALSSASAPVLERAGVPAGAVRLVDGSGLSRDNALAPGALTRLLTSLTAGDPGRLAPLLTGLPVGGFSGTLSDRYRAGPQVAGAGVVRAKTGTLMGVSALAGLVRTAQGRLLAFALSAEAVPTGGTRAAEAALDRLASAVASCGCR
jgi:D-alanyl-D-alanine carboxypeptidase/D-alanyl-D-alanine-endopeptidase (penicillin-binding protein 4)